MKRLAVISFCIFVLTLGSANAQGTNARILGTVTDAAGAVMPGVSVTAQNTATGVLTSTTTNDAGVYEFPSLQSGVYRLIASKSGFQTFIYDDVAASVSARLNVSIELTVAGITQDVEVVAPLDSALMTNTASVGKVIEGVRIRDLPLPGRDALGLVLTQPGLVGNNLGGARIGAVNVTRDGINVMDQRINLGVNSVVFTSSDLVEEMRVITSPADTELGRGSGQIQILTRSGTNNFHGTVFESNRNTALTANSFFNNRSGIPRDDLIRNQFGGALGGPIIRNRTFFYFLYDGQRQVTRDAVTSIVYTTDARQGVFRFFPGVRNGNTDAAVPTVDLLGNPVRPATATASLQSVSLFGRDAIRPGFDPTGTVQRLISFMPLPNDFRFGDGLNTSGYSWRRRDTDDRDQFDIKFDHVFNEDHRLSFSHTREREDLDNGFMPQSLPASPGGKLNTKGTFFSLHLSSVLSPSLLNDFTAGAQRARLRFLAPWELGSGASLLPKTAGGAGYLPVMTLVNDVISSESDPQGRISPFYVVSDKLSWRSGRHGMKAGGEARFVSTNGFNSFDVMPRAYFGAGGRAVAGVSATTIVGIGRNVGTAQNLLIDLSGSLNGVVQAFNATASRNPVFLAGEGKQRTWRQREFSLFFQDDFQVRPRLTLNLGIRYDFYGVPWEGNGQAAALVGGSAGLFGVSGTDWADLYRPGHLAGSLTQIQLVGKNSANPSSKLYKNDWNNFAPVAGLSWSIPYFGQDKTVLRVGYSVSYQREALRLIDIASGDQPGLNTETTFTSAQYLDLGRIQLPLQPLGAPLDTVPLTDRTQTAYAFDQNIRIPYIQNWNLSIERELPDHSSAIVRYVGSKGTKLWRTVNINEVNLFETGLAGAFLTTQSGGNAPLFDRIFHGLDLGLGPVNGTTVTGSASLRNNANTYFYFGDNSAGTFASYVNETSDFTGVRGGLLRNGSLPENFIVGNPQFQNADMIGNFSNSTFHALELEWNKRFLNGWTLDSNYTWSKALGDEEGSSQALLNSFRDGRNRRLDKRLLDFNVAHVLRNSGTVELPFGPGKKFLSGSNGWLAHFFEGWQMGGIVNVFSGSPVSFVTGTASFNQFGEQPGLAGDFPKNAGRVTRQAGGVVFFPGLHIVDDPVITKLTPLQLLNESSTLTAVADSSGKILLINPAPGELGNMPPQFLKGPGYFRFDVNLIKRIHLRGGKTLQLRADAINATNTPQWANPDTNINSQDFGRIASAGGSRILVLNARVEF